MILSILSGTGVLLGGFLYKKCFLLQDECSPSVLQSSGDVLSVELKCLLHFHNAMSGQDKTWEKSLDVTPKFSLEEGKEWLKSSFTKENWEEQKSTVKPPWSSMAAPTSLSHKFLGLRTEGFHGSAGMFAGVVRSRGVHKGTENVTRRGSEENQGLWEAHVKIKWLPVIPLYIRNQIKTIFISSFILFHFAFFISCK